MKIRLLALGQRMPTWVTQSFDEYAKRMPKPWSLQLVEIAPGNRSKGADIAKAKLVESQRLVAAIPNNACRIALDVAGDLWSTEQFAQKMANWQHQFSEFVLLIGGPDGIDSSILSQSDARWSLGRITLPHPLVRVIVAEQMYRVWSLLNHHPYHRA